MVDLKRGRRTVSASHPLPAVVRMQAMVAAAGSASVTPLPPQHFQLPPQQQQQQPPPPPLLPAQGFLDHGMAVGVPAGVVNGAGAGPGAVAGGSNNGVHGMVHGNNNDASGNGNNQTQEHGGAQVLYHQQAIAGGAAVGSVVGGVGVDGIAAGGVAGGVPLGGHNYSEQQQQQQQNYHQQQQQPPQYSHPESHHHPHQLQQQQHQHQTNNNIPNGLEGGISAGEGGEEIEIVVDVGDYSTAGGGGGTEGAGVDDHLGIQHIQQHEPIHPAAMDPALSHSQHGVSEGGGIQHGGGMMPGVGALMVHGDSILDGSNGGVVGHDMGTNGSAVGAGSGVVGVVGGAEVDVGGGRGLKRPWPSPNCEELNCFKNPSYGANGTPPLRCASHKIDGDVYVKNQCIQLGCSKVGVSVLYSI